jgi:hypothetical protein
MQIMSGPSIHTVDLRVRFKMMPTVNHKQRKRKLSIPKRNEIILSWRKLHNKELRYSMQYRHRLDNIQMDVTEILGVETG